MKTKKISIILPYDLYIKLIQEALENDVDVSKLVRKTLRTYFSSPINQEIKSKNQCDVNQTGTNR